MPNEKTRFSHLIYGYEYIINLLENKGVSVVIANQTPTFNVIDNSTCFKYWFRPFKDKKYGFPGFSMSFCFLWRARGPGGIQKAS